jgi:hypothetical protein
VQLLVHSLLLLLLAPLWLLLVDALQLAPPVLLLALRQQLPRAQHKLLLTALCQQLPAGPPTQQLL